MNEKLNRIDKCCIYKYATFIIHRHGLFLGITGQLHYMEEKFFIINEINACLFESERTLIYTGY